MNLERLNLRQFLSHLAQQGGTLSVEGDKLRVRLPRATPEWEENLRRRKPEILALLAGTRSDRYVEEAKRVDPNDPGSSPWFDVRRHVDSDELVVRLFCFPWACGSASIFADWCNHLPDFVEVCGLKLPGRPPRGLEEPIVCLESLLDALEESMLPFLNRPFVFYGHSMGSMVAFELARQLRRGGRPQPVQLLLAAQHALRPSQRPVLFSDAPEADFRQGWADLGGTPGEVLEYQELLEYYEPVFRADHKVRESYVYRDEEPLDVAISVYGGESDEHVPLSELKSWRAHTRAAFEWKLFPGTHFFIESSRGAVLAELSRVFDAIRRDLEGGLEGEKVARP